MTDDRIDPLGLLARIAVHESANSDAYEAQYLAAREQNESLRARIRCVLRLAAWVDDESDADARVFFRHAQLLLGRPDVGPPDPAVVRRLLHDLGGLPGYAPMPTRPALSPLDTP